MSSLPGVTLEQWALAFLDFLVLPKTEENVRAVTSWERAESGDPPNAGQWNPLNTTQDWPGAWQFNSVGVKNYPTMRAGIGANAKALTNGRYGPVLTALESGVSAQAVTRAVEQSPWGTKNIVLIPPLDLPQPVHTLPNQDNDPMIVMAPARLQKNVNRPVFAWCDNANKHLWTYGHRLTQTQLDGPNGDFVLGIPATGNVLGILSNNGDETITVGAAPSDATGAPAFHYQWAQ
jgi:hypothetical protein